MEEILEIRDGCKTPTQLLKSKAFSIYLEIYKKQFIKELENREDSTIKEEVLHKNISSQEHFQLHYQLLLSVGREMQSKLILVRGHMIVGKTIAILVLFQNLNLSN